MSDAAVLVSFQHATLPMISENFDNSGDIEKVFNEWYYHLPCYSASRWWGDLSCISVWLHPETKWFWSSYYLCCDNTFHRNANVICMISNICMISKIQPAIYKSIAANLLEMVSGDLKPKPKHWCECVIILIPDLKQIMKRDITWKYLNFPTSSFNVYCGQWTMDIVCNTFCGLR